MVKMDKSSEKRVTKGRNHVFLAALLALIKRPRHTYEASGSTLLIVAIITIPQSSGGWAVASNREVLQITASG